MILNNKIGLGTVQFGIPYGISNVSGQTNELEVSKILEYAKQNDIIFIDTASAYGNAENVLGNNDLTGFKIISKFMPCSISEEVAQQFNASLDKLHVNSLYGYLAHRPQNLFKNKNQWDALLKLKETGKVKKIGYSLNQPFELEELLSIGMDPDLIQVPFNFFDNRFKGLMKGLKEIGCEIHTRSTFLQGLFFMNPNQLPDFFNDVRGNITDLHAAFPNNLPGALLKYVLMPDFVDVVIMGIENQQQLMENLNSLINAQKIPFTVSEINESILMPSTWPKFN